MKKYHSLILLFTLLCLSAVAQTKATQSGPHIPANGSAERKAIVNALRGDQDVIFKVHYIKVHGDWCWIDTTRPCNC